MGQEHWSLSFIRGRTTESELGTLNRGFRHDTVERGQNQSWGKVEKAVIKTNVGQILGFG